MWVYLTVKSETGKWRIDKAHIALDNGVRHEAKVNDPTTWATLAQAQAAYRTGNFDGIGFVFNPQLKMSGADYDNVLKDGREQPVWADEIMGVLGPTYTEFSVSGLGLHSLVDGDFKGHIAEKFSDGCGFEFYSDLRFFCTTGRPWNGTLTLASPECQAFYDAFQHGEYGPEDFKAQQAAKPEKDPNGPKRIIDVKAAFKKHKIKHGKANVQESFTRWDVTCPDPNCGAKNAYVMQFTDGGAVMACYHATCEYSNQKAKNYWNKFEAYHEAKAKADGGATSSEKEL